MKPIRVFPEKFIERAPENRPFRLHGGEGSMIRYDVNSMLMDPVWREKIVESIPDGRYHYIGIPTGGAIIATLAAHENTGEVSMIKDRVLKGGVPGRRCLVLDDVCTTEGSLRAAYDILRARDVSDNRISYYVVVDRRPKLDRVLEIGSMFDLGEIS